MLAFPDFLAVVLSNKLLKYNLLCYMHRDMSSWSLYYVEQFLNCIEQHRCQVILRAAGIVIFAARPN